MGRNTNIAYVHHSFSPWWGCMPVGAECAECFATAMTKRAGRDCFGLKPRHFFKESHWLEPPRWNRSAEKRGVREQVLCGSMCDVMETPQKCDAWSMEDARNRLWKLIIECKNLDFLLLTKRPENFPLHLPPIWREGVQGNIWLGTTAGTQTSANKNVPELIKVRAPVHFVSVEPMLEPVTLAPWFGRGQVNWVICGCEKVGNRCGRLMRPVWAELLAEECKLHGVPFFLKQMPDEDHRLVLDRPEINGRQLLQMPLRESERQQCRA